MAWLMARSKSDESVARPNVVAQLLPGDQLARTTGEICQDF